MKILVVDDSSAISKLVKEMLEELGHQVEVATDGVEAYSFFQEGKKADLVLLDWNMPNMNGIELLEKNFNERFTEASIVMMTTENKPERIREALKFGASEYIMKPFTQDILESKIKSVAQKAA